jgi:methyltransferase (TIGR00027 family)
MVFQIRGLGQPDDSPITKTAAWLACTGAVLMKEPAFAQLLDDPFSESFAEAVSPTASERLAELDDAALRRAWILKGDATSVGSVGVCLYRKVWFRDQARRALEEGATQLVIFGAGCDTLSARLARANLRPATFEIDYPAMASFRERILAKLPVDLSHVHQIGVDFSRQDFRSRLIEEGYDPQARTLFVAEGVLEYLDNREIDDIFEFIRSRSGEGGTIVHSFSDTSIGESPIAVSAQKNLPGETWTFAVDPEDIGPWYRERGFVQKSLATARDIEEGFMQGIQYPPGHPRLMVTPFSHFAVAAVSS